MPKKSAKAPRNIRLGQTSELFVAEVRPPFTGNQTMDRPEHGIAAQRSYISSDGRSQIFKYIRLNFGMKADERQSEFVKHALNVAEHLGDIAVDTQVIDIENGRQSLFEEPTKEEPAKIAA